MSGMVNDNGFLEDDFQQTFDSLRLQNKAEEVVGDLDQYIQTNYGGQIESALLTRSGHYGMSLMADSALMQEKFGYDPEAQEVADLDLCITVSDDIQGDIPEIRDLFKKEDGSYGEFNKRYDEVEINPRILHEGGLIGKLEKAAEEWRKDIPESVNFPDVDGSETSRHPVNFLGYFHEGFTPLKQSEKLQDTIEYTSDVITNQDGRVYEEIWEDIWDDFSSRMRFKPEVMDKNAELGKIEMAKTNSNEFDYSRDTYADQLGVRKEDRDIGNTDLSQKLKDQLADNEEILEWFEGEYPYELTPNTTNQKQLNLSDGPEPEASPDEEIIRRKVVRFLEDHPDIEKAARDGNYQFAFGKDPLSGYFGDDFELKIAEGAAKSALGRQIASRESEEKQNRVNKNILEF